MKSRIITIALAATVLAASSCNPLRVVLNTQSPDGERKIVTSEKIIASEDGVNLSMCMGTRIHAKDTVVAIALSIDAATGKSVFDKGDKFMLKLGDGRTVTLVNILEDEYEEHTETHVQDRPVYTGIRYSYAYSPWAGPVFVTPYDAYAMVPEVYTTKVANSYALYLITKEDLSGIIYKGVKKMRIEIDRADLDITDTKDIAPLIKSMVMCLIDGAKTEIRKGEF